jgi:hypothetical protein
VIHLKQDKVPFVVVSGLRLRWRTELAEVSTQAGSVGLLKLDERFLLAVDARGGR